MLVLSHCNASVAFLLRRYHLLSQCQSDRGFGSIETSIRIVHVICRSPVSRFVLLQLAHNCSEGCLQVFGLGLILTS